MKYLVLLRGVNVGGKNKVSMAELKVHLSKAGFQDTSTYINSGNVFVSSDQPAKMVARKVEEVLQQNFTLDTGLIKVRAFDLPIMETIVTKAPHDFGTQPSTYHSDVLFPLDGTTSADIMAITETNPDVDTAWEANGVVYYQRVSALRTRSRLSKIIDKPVYKEITIRSWNTTIKLLALLRQQ